MAVSSTVIAGQAAQATQFNNLRSDILDVTNGHDHSGASDHGILVVTVPIGAIIMWSGSVAAIPSGWQLANGTNGTPDLRGRFVIGAGSTYSANATGGATTKNIAHTHTASSVSAANESAHTHAAGTLTTNAAGTHSHTITLVPGGPDNQLLYAASSGVKPNDAGTVPTATHTHALTGTSGAGAAHNHTLGGSTASGGSATQDILPPYYSLCYIVRMS